MSVTTSTVSLTVSATEQVTQTFGGTSELKHVLKFAQSYATGTGASEIDVVYEETVSFTGVRSYDVLGTLVGNLDGATVSFVDYVGHVVLNQSTTTMETIQVGGGSNPIPAFGQQTIGPGGMAVFFTPQDGVTPVAGTGDLLNIDAGGNTISVRVLILGRSA